MELTLTKEREAAIMRAHGEVTAYCQGYIDERADYLIGQQEEEDARKMVAILLAKTPEERTALVAPILAAEKAKLEAEPIKEG